MNSENINYSKALLGCRRQTGSINALKRYYRCARSCMVSVKAGPAHDTDRTRRASVRAVAAAITVTANGGTQKFELRAKFAATLAQEKMRL
jgi:hypothetical protein